MADANWKKRKLRDQFPRTDTLPSQSSKFWTKEKDRYLRQLLISDIEELTGRELIVYYAQLSEGISHTDPDDLSEIIEGLSSKDVDLLIQTPGGAVDAVEKFVSVLKSRLDGYRVIVPSWAKSGGTVIAISASEILLGVNSELGPIDPQMFMPELGPVPAEFIAADETKDPVLRQYAAATVARMKNLARKILRSGMLNHVPDDKFEEVLKKLSSSTEYGSHGAVIDYGEAQELGLKVTWMPPEERLWKLIWMLYCTYDFDTKSRGLGRVIEGSINSIARPQSV